VQFLAGEIVSRGCIGQRGSFPDFQDKELKELQDRLAGREPDSVSTYVCNDRNFCNGSDRLAEISTMMILLSASTVLAITFFSRL